MKAIIKNVWTNTVENHIEITNEEKAFWYWLSNHGYISDTFRLIVIDKEDK